MCGDTLLEGTGADGKETGSAGAKLQVSTEWGGDSSPREARGLVSQASHRGLDLYSTAEGPPNVRELEKSKIELHYIIRYYSIILV